jgi:hypothetical protein
MKTRCRKADLFPPETGRLFSLLQTGNKKESVGNTLLRFIERLYAQKINHS